MVSPTRIRRILALATLALSTACSDHQLPGEPQLHTPQFNNSSASATSAFAWLPPIGKDPGTAPVNDAALLPYVHVRVCAANGSACTTLTDVRANREHFLAQWKSDKAQPANATNRIVVDVAGTVVGQTDVKVNPGQMLPIKFSIAPGAINVVTNAGGTVNAANDAVKLVVPAGALRTPIVITVETLATYPTTTGIGVLDGSVYSFTPDGARFNPPAQLTIRYDERALPAGVTETDLQLGHLENGVWQAIPGSVVNTTDNTVTGPVSGFSAWGVVYSFGATSLVHTMWGRGTATIDGALAAGEWDDAAIDTFVVHLPDGTSTMGEWRVMNDDQNLYVSVRFARPSLDFETHLNVHYSNQDQWIVSRNPLGTTFTDAFGPSLTQDVTSGGTNDGAGAIDNDGTYTIIEISHPLNSADNAHDMSFNVGDIIMGYRVSVLLSSGGGGYTTSTAPGIAYAGQIVLVGNTPVMSGIGTATIDGVMSPGEWGSADCTTFNVQRPNTVPAPAVFCVMNDAVNLYTSLTYADGAPQFSVTYALHLDQNGSHEIDNGDDLWLSSATRVQNGLPTNIVNSYFFDEHWFSGGVCPINSLCSTEDTNAGGTSDGAGAFDLAGRTFETVHPLNSGDPRDVHLSGGQVIGARVGFSLNYQSAATAVTLFPNAGLIQLVIR